MAAIQQVDYLTQTAEVGQRVTFNSFMVDAAHREAQRVLQKKKKRYGAGRTSELILCGLNLKTIPGSGPGRDLIRIGRLCEMEFIFFRPSPFLVYRKAQSIQIPHNLPPGPGRHRATPTI